MCCVSISLVSKIESTLGYSTERIHFRELGHESQEAEKAKWETWGNKEQWEAAITTGDEWTKGKVKPYGAASQSSKEGMHPSFCWYPKEVVPQSPELRLLRRGDCSAAADASEGCSEASFGSCKISWWLNKSEGSFLGWLATKTGSNPSSSLSTFQTSSSVPCWQNLSRM